MNEKIPNKKQQLLAKLHMTNDEMCECIENSMVDYFRTIVQTGNRKFELTPEYGWVDTFPTAWSNCVFYFNSENVTAGIERLKQRMVCGEIPKEWLIGPKSSPKDLCQQLEKAGFAKNYYMTGMAKDLEDEDYAIEDIEEFQVIEVTTKELLLIWANIVSLALWNGKTFEADLFLPLMNNPDYKFYLGYWNGEAVATSMILLINNIATVDMISTMSHARKHGFGTLMVKYALNYAKSKGYKYAVLQASQSGRPIYRKMGFEEYCEFYDYRLEETGE